ncbi:MAG: hypothetical protein M3460_23110 [Actinomycetota bacterium]|nr:hypothetical protein [Actinomycetota bacterium]
MSDLLLILALLFFLILDGSSFPRRLAAAGAQRPQLVGALVSFARGARRYVVVSTVFGLIVAVLDVGVLYWLAVPLPMALGAGVVYHQLRPEHRLRARRSNQRLILGRRAEGLLISVLEFPGGAALGEVGHQGAERLLG